MILLDNPYVSDYLKQTIKKQNYTLIATKESKKFSQNLSAIEEQEAVTKFRTTKNPKLYTNSENSINWIEKHLSFTDLPQKIKLFKNKIEFRKLIKELHPNYFFQAVKIGEIEKLDISNFPFPFIIKPAVGFFSLGVYKVETKKEWDKTIKNIKAEIKETKSIYPIQVLNTSEFIVEECIKGTEYAIDCYFDEYGNAIVLGILKHLFSGSNDVSDRVYISSKEIIEENLLVFQNYLNEIGKLAQLKNFPAHVEVRVRENGEIIPIEVNPMRFGGWCTTADLANYAYGFNAYEYFFENKKPDWESLLKNKANKTFSIVVLDNSSSFEGSEIKSFDYNKLLKKFEKPLELRKIDYNEYPVFGFLFCETKTENLEELQYILKSDLEEFILAK